MKDWISRTFFVQRNGTLELRQMYYPDLVEYYKLMNNQEKRTLKRGILEEY